MPRLMPVMLGPRIYADFHNLDDANRLRLTCVGTREDLARQGIESQEGLRLTFCMDDANDGGQPDDMLAEGVTHYDQEGQSRFCPARARIDTPAP